MWHQVDGGGTIGQTGSEGGYILLDESMDGFCRITLEKGGFIAPYGITCGIYGQMVHTAYAGDLTEAQQKYENMKRDLAAFSDAEDDSDWCVRFAAKW